MGKQKIIRVGNSVAVTIPKEVLQKTGWRPGDEVMVETDRMSEVMEVYGVGLRKKDAGVTPELMGWVKDFHKQYGNDLKKLAKR